jgi:hypothetical protein
LFTSKKDITPATAEYARSPVGVAARAFQLAVRAVAENDFDDVFTRWRRLRFMLKGQHSYWSKPHNQSGACQSDLTDLRNVFESDRLDVYLASEAKWRAIEAGIRQLEVIVERFAGRLVETEYALIEDQAVDHELPEDVSRELQDRLRQRETGAGPDPVRDTAVQRINTQTRRILDLDDQLKSFTVAEWRSRHGLDKRPSK